MVDGRLLKAIYAWCAVALFAAVASPATADDIMSVSGNRLMRNNEPFEVHGVEISAFEAPPDWFQRPTEYPNSALQLAYSGFSGDELRRARDFGANTVLFQVSHTGLDPLNTSSSTSDRVGYSLKYFMELVNGVHLARQAGFVVFVSIADTTFSGDRPGHSLPTAATVRAGHTASARLQG